MITIYLIAYNEELLLPYTVEFYRSRFPDCEIIVYDNFSTDNTVDLALSLKCQVKQFYTSDNLSDQAFINIKNNCWKNAKTDWVIVCDMDEWIDVNEIDILREDCSVLKTFYVDMIGATGENEPNKMNHGIIYPEDGKLICFNRRKVEEINYGYGCHNAEPFGEIVFSQKRYVIQHYKWLSLAYVIGRHHAFGKRLSSHNLRNKLSFHYLFSKNKIRRQYNNYVKRAKRIDMLDPLRQLHAQSGFSNTLLQNEFPNQYGTSRMAFK